MFGPYEQAIRRSLDSFLTHVHLASNRPTATNTTHLTNVGLMPCQLHRRWHGIKPALVELLVFSA